MKKVHFIAIGGAVMHNLAIALCQKGYKVSGSDDEIFEPARSRLDQYGILPHDEGWFVQRIHPGLDAVILGMHARIDNPELVRAQELGLKIYSFPEYIYEQSRNKLRIVVGGSHGKTTITAMIMHVFRQCNKDFDYMVGSQLEGFETMVRLSENAPVTVLEGDEYLTSPMDPRPKFHLYHPNIAVLSGIAWDHINVFPTFENYTEQFRIFASLIEFSGALVYCGEDEALVRIAAGLRSDVRSKAYSSPPHRIENGITLLETEFGDIPLLIFGKHNLQNLEAARLACEYAGIPAGDFYTAIRSFKGASRRLELIAHSGSCSVFRDFAHSPSKLSATINAVAGQFPERKLVACMELHTFSSLSENFLEQYRGSMDAATVPIVYFNPRTLEHKKLPPLTADRVKEAFRNPAIRVYTDSGLLQDDLLAMDWNNSNLLMMSSGNFDGIDMTALGPAVIRKAKPQQE